MIQGTESNLNELLAQLRDESDSLAVDQRRRLVASVVEAILCQDGTHESVVTEVLALLAGDPDWSVRLEVARTLHLLGDEACSQLMARLRADCNTYVRKHAERSLARQRKVRETSTRRRSECRTYADQIDQLERQYGKKVAAKVQALADQRFTMLAAAVAHDVRSILTTLSTNASALATELDGATRPASILEDIWFLKRTIEAMEQFSKPEPLQRHPEDIHEIILQAAEKAREALINQGHDPVPVEIVVNSTPAIQVRVSRRLIVLALTNVIQNAFESFSDRDADALRPGRIEAQVIVDGYETRILIRDNGPGIEPQVLRELRCFAPTGPNKAKRNSSGWGPEPGA